MRFYGRKVAVVGLAVNNTPLIKFLVSQGADIIVLDRKTPEKLDGFLKELQGLPLQYHLGPDYLSSLKGREIIFLSPGIPKNLPALKDAVREGSTLSSELQLFMDLNHSPLIGITGSSGKTTTTTLVGEMLTGVKPVKVGGNIGQPPLSFLAELTDETWVALELSSFQLQGLGRSPDIAVVTNITPNHLDAHSSMDEYIQAKTEILRYQTRQDLAILNYDNRITRNMAELVVGERYFFSRVIEPSPGAFLRGDNLILSMGDGGEELICERREIKILGEHNIENILAAALTSRLAGAPLRRISEVIREFTGVEHRLELVGEQDGIRYYNDSISTTPDRAIAGLRAISGPVILIAGGYDKRLSFEEFVTVAAQRCRMLILLGQTAEEIRRSLFSAVAPEKRPMVHMVSDLQEAVKVAAKAAQPGETVLLSPASASYDMFANFEERGRLFKELVNETVFKSRNNY